MHGMNVNKKNKKLALNHTVWHGIPPVSNLPQTKEMTQKWSIKNTEWTSGPKNYTNKTRWVKNEESYQLPHIYKSKTNCLPSSSQQKLFQGRQQPLPKHR